MRVWLPVWLPLSVMFIDTVDIQTIEELVEYLAESCGLFCFWVTIIFERFRYSGAEDLLKAHGNEGVNYACKLITCAARSTLILEYEVS